MSPQILKFNHPSLSGSSLGPTLFCYSSFAYSTKLPILHITYTLQLSLSPCMLILLDHLSPTTYDLTPASLLLKQSSLVPPATFLSISHACSFALSFSLITYDSSACIITGSTIALWTCIFALTHNSPWNTSLVQIFLEQVHVESSNRLTSSSHVLWKTSSWKNCRHALWSNPPAIRDVPQVCGSLQTDPIDWRPPHRKISANSSIHRTIHPIHNGLEVGLVDCLPWCT